MLDQLNALDTSLFLKINGWHSPFWDRIMWFISGKIEWMPFYILLTLFLICRFKKQSIFMIAGAIIAVILADQLAVHAFKEVIGRLRPSHDPDISNIVHIINNYRGGLYGFVSNHAANSFSLAAYLSLIVRKNYFTAIMFSWAVLLSYSRIYLGVHYPGDVICGAVLGLFIGWGIYKVYGICIRKPDQTVKPTIDL
jgi:undecaprenyl-diphosphatase